MFGKKLKSQQLCRWVLALYFHWDILSKNHVLKVLESFRQFALGTHFKRAALFMMAYSLTSEEIKDLHDVFVALDKSHDGTIKLTEMARIMKERLDVSSAECERIFEKLDYSHDGKIEYTEFLAAMLTHKLVGTRFLFFFAIH